MSATQGFLVCALSLCIASATLAAPVDFEPANPTAPNLVGTTGLLYTPSTLTEPSTELNVSLNATHDAPGIELALNYGVLPHWEVGITRLGEKETVLNTKYCFQTETDTRIGIAAGVMDLTNQECTVGYAVASKAFDPDIYFANNFHFNLGLAAGGKKYVDARDPARIPGSLALNGIFTGLSFDIANSVTALAEYDGRNFNFGFRDTFFKQVTGTIGYLGANKGLTGGLSYNVKL